jgi:CubicO group peptidase (beta-lactamase class C family)
LQADSSPCAEARRHRHFEWVSAAPDHHGFDADRLEVLQEDLARRGTKAFLIVRYDSIVWEWYAPDQGAEMRHYSSSLAKGVVGGLSFAVAMEDGRIAADDPASEYVSSWAHDSVRSRITIRHLATHSSGIKDADIPGSSLGQTDLPGWKGAFWQCRQPEEDGLDPFSLAVYQAPILFEPGSDYAYSNPGMAGAPRLLRRRRFQHPEGGDHSPRRALRARCAFFRETVRQPGGRD